MNQPISIACPYCGERFESAADGSAGDQHYIEDCAICCQPIEIDVCFDDDGNLQTLSARRGDE